MGLDPTVIVAAGPGRGLRIGLRHASADYQLGTNELAVQRAIVERLGRGDVFYDVGANVGFFSLVAARAVGPEGHVFAFEAVPFNAGRIEANARRNGFDNVTVLAVAAGAGPESAQLHLARHPGGAVLASAGIPPDLAGTIQVEVVAIDDLVEAGEVTPPTVVKLDVEGAEEAALRGLQRTLARHQPAVVLEVDDAADAGLDARLSAFHDWFSALGYRLDRLPASYAGNEWRVAHVVAEHCSAEGAHEAHRAEP